MFDDPNQGFPWERVEAAKRYLYLVKPWWSRYVEHFTIVPVYVPPAEGEKYGFVTSTDISHRIYIDRTFATLAPLSLVSGMIEHEVLHHTRDTWNRFKGESLEDWDAYANIAMDLEINSVIESDGERLDFEEIQKRASRSQVFPLSDMSKWGVTEPPGLSDDVWSPKNTGLPAHLSAETYFSVIKGIVENQEADSDDQRASDSGEQESSAESEEQTEESTEEDSKTTPDSDSNSDSSDSESSEKESDTDDSTTSDSDEAESDNEEDSADHDDLLDELLGDDDDDSEEGTESKEESDNSSEGQNDSEGTDDDSGDADSEGSQESEDGEDEDGSDSEGADKGDENSESDKDQDSDDNSEDSSGGSSSSANKDSDSDSPGSTPDDKGSASQRKSSDGNSGSNGSATNPSGESEDVNVTQEIIDAVNERMEEGISSLTKNAIQNPNDQTQEPFWKPQEQDMTAPTTQEIVEAEEQLVEDYQATAWLFGDKEDSPGGLNQWIVTNRKASKISWEQTFARLLNAAATSARVQGQSDLSFMVRNPHQPAIGVVLPGLHDYAPKIYVIIDISASMKRSSGMRAAIDIFEEMVRSVLNRFGTEVIWVSADQEIRNVGRVTTWRDDMEAKFVFSFGGTDLYEIIEETALKGLTWEGKRYPKPDLVVAITDCIFAWSDKRPRSAAKLLVVDCDEIADRSENFIPSWLNRRTEYVKVQYVDGSP